MKKEELFDAIGYIDDELIFRSDTVKKSRIITMTRGIAAAAACAAIVIGAGIAINRIPANEGITSETQTTVQDGGNGPIKFDPSNPIYDDKPAEPSKDYGMSPELSWVDFNAGPIMPVTFAEENGNITAERKLEYDFTDVTKESKGKVDVSDSYTLTNNSDSEQTVTMYYPYISDISGLSEDMPAVKINEQTKKAVLLNGAYFGKDSNGTLRLFEPTVSADEYGYMLEEVKPLDVNYMQEFLDKKVMVYEFGNFETGVYPTESVSFEVSFRTDNPESVYTSDAFSTDYDGEYLTVSFIVDSAMNGKPAVYFIDDAPEKYTVQGYNYIDTTSENKSDEIKADVNEYEATVKDIIEQHISGKNGTDSLDKLYSERVAQMFSDMYKWNTDGVYTAEDDIFYEASVSDIVYTVSECESVYIVSETITIAAGESVSVCFDYVKQGTYCTNEPQKEFRDNYCYDNMPCFGTNVDFTSQSTAICEEGNISIESQNYGFDIENGVTEVQLELEAERYYMIVKVLK